LRTALLALLAFLSAASPASLGHAFAGQASPRASDSQAFQFKILSPDGKQTIGFTHFVIVRNNSAEELKGESQYADGERDDENEQLDAAKENAAPRLETYEHTFFNADGTPHMVDALNAKSGLASCTIYTNGKMKVRKSQLRVPADSVAGASGPLIIAGNLRRGIREITFHAFACVPGPEIFSVKAPVPVRPEHWRLYPGSLFRLDMRPNLGPLNLFLEPFLPTTNAWFNPGDNWNYAGGEYDRYFRGPHVLTVLVRP